MKIDDSDNIDDYINDELLEYLITNYDDLESIPDNIDIKIKKMLKDAYEKD